MEDIIYDFFAASLQDGYIGKLKDIVEAAGGSRQLYHMDENHMLGMGLTSRMTNYIINRRNSTDPEKEYEMMLNRNIRFIRHFDSEYPQRLKNVESAPFALFNIGELPPDDIPAVAIVGSRECSEYGRNMAEYFANRLAEKGISIISGMAYGIDGISQMSAIDAGGKTYAVLGCGADVIYPSGNRGLYERIISGNGGVISEYAPGTKARSRNFPPRNRIISGLCDVLIVVEARARSGTLITADLAMDQGREVMIIPGRLTDPMSIGCVNLMKNGAFPALCVEDVLDRLPVKFCQNKNAQTSGKSNQRSSTQNSGEMENRNGNSPNTCEANFRNSLGTKSVAKRLQNTPVQTPEIKSKNTCALTEEEQKVYECLDFYPLNVNAVAKAASMNISRLLTVLTSMEIKGAVRSIGQGAFVKTS